MRTSICFIAALLLAANASAQLRYSCRSADGSTTFSDRPCTGQLFFATPSESSRSQPSIGTAPSHLQYMSPRCASLNDALRTAPARGLKSETISTMRRDYQAECGENENEARQQMSRDSSAQRQQRSAEQKAQTVARNDAKLREQQCEESKRILITKRNRPNLTEGERDELKRFEDNYRARCAP
ncbi:MAG TPA: DUF4124 domain-containing protein [Burkholderiales bacterium]|nr:DUF4124 domain-containing protein [Burkholderiales bacterium]